MVKLSLRSLIKIFRVRCDTLADTKRIKPPDLNEAELRVAVYFTDRMFVIEAPEDCQRCR